MRTTVTRLAVPAAFFLFVALCGWAMWHDAQRVTRLRETALLYCTKASALNASPLLDDMRDGMQNGDDLSGIIFKAATDGFAAQCARDIDVTLDNAMPQ